MASAPNTHTVTVHIEFDEDTAAKIKQIVRHEIAMFASESLTAAVYRRDRQDEDVHQCRSCDQRNDTHSIGCPMHPDYDPDMELREKRNSFIAESSDEFADADPAEVAKLLEEATSHARPTPAEKGRYYGTNYGI